jgi:hypothetical protein
VVLASDLPAAAPERMGSRDVHEWLLARGAIDFHETQLTVVMTNVSKEPLRVTNMRVEVVERRTPLQGTLINCPTAGASSVLLLVVDLDDPEPAVWEWQEDGNRTRVGTVPYFARGRIALSPGEVHEIFLVVQTSMSWCRWHLCIDFELAGKTRSVVAPVSPRQLQTSGRPTGGFANELDYAWYDGGRFQPPPEIDFDFDELPES